jgi:ArsR family transcriptional regulator
MNDKQVIAALSALAQESRLGIFRILVQCGPEGMAASKIGDLLSISPSSMSFHLKELTHAGLIYSRNESRYVIYSANFEAMNGVVGFLTENCCGGNVFIPSSKCMTAAETENQS